MPAKVRRVDFSPDEWIAGTIGLSLADEGLYIRACALIYSHGGPIAIEHLQKACREDHGHTVNASLRRLVEAGKLSSNSGQIDSKRCAKEIQNALKRIANGRQNGLKGGRPKGLAEPGGYSVPKLTTNYQLERKKDLAPKELNPVFLSEPRGSPPLPSRGDGGAPRGSTTKEAQVNSDDLITPEQRAAGLAELHRMRDAARRKATPAPPVSSAASINGHAEAAE